MTFELKPIPVDPRPPKENNGSLAGTQGIKDNFTLSTWLLVGAFLHGIASLVLPSRYALLPVLVLLLHRIISTMLMYFGVTRNIAMDGVHIGRFSALIPGKDGTPPTGMADRDIGVIMLATRSNQSVIHVGIFWHGRADSCYVSPLGVFGPGYNQIGEFMSEMQADLHKHADELGCEYQLPSRFRFCLMVDEGKSSDFGIITVLGSTAWVNLGERATSNQIMVICYFRSAQAIHDYAHGPVHRRAWNWWNSIVKTHPHLSIMHEMYHVPKKNWENIYVNYHVTSLANMGARMNMNGESLRPLFDASRGALRTSKGRMGSGDGTDNEKYEKTAER
ncbi:hypothetical protein B0H66DRAFT_381233 [Apodospora peruviana]|uniref:Uncharacterized protein n=1 Tax=Apodospora peruviana TaxID=516989 RepID=A0AAE0HVQ2_9PEZI|nr:hypothetical protein B0H66DRAFT_381233 [Apodospora peruviana]